MVSKPTYVWLRSDDDIDLGPGTKVGRATLDEVARRVVESRPSFQGRSLRFMHGMARPSVPPISQSDPRARSVDRRPNHLVVPAP
jgi:hypothetical protein